MSVSVQEMTDEDRLQIELIEEHKRAAIESNKQYVKTNAEYQDVYNKFRASESAAFKKLQGLYKYLDKSMRSTSSYIPNTQLVDEYNEELTRLEQLRCEVFEIQREAYVQLQRTHEALAIHANEVTAGLRARIDQLEKECEQLRKYQTTRPNNI